MWRIKASSILRTSVTSGAALCTSALIVEEKLTNGKGVGKLLQPTAADGTKLSRKIVSATDKNGLDLRLYQYQTCPYCSKVRAVMDYYGLSYEVVEVNPVTRNQLKFAKGQRKVPVVTSSKAEGFLTESSQIISILATYLNQRGQSFEDIVSNYPKHEAVENGKTVTTYPNKFVLMLNERRLSDTELQNAREERQWREWVDDHFVHIISPNVYRTWSESLETFHYFDSIGEWERNFPAWERYLAIYMGAAAMFMISKRLKKRHNIVDERAAMLTALNEFLEAKGANRAFLGGKDPNLADLALYGAINSFVGCRAFTEMREQCKIGEWYDNVHRCVEEHRGAAILQRH